MIGFKLFYEVAFKNRRDVALLQRVPKFTIFYKKEDYSESQVELLRDKEDYIAGRCALAAKALGKLGFKSQHTNILISDLSDRVNQNTGGGVGGYANRSGNYMAIDGDLLFSNPDYAVKVIVHEVAHLRMFRGGKAFREAVWKYYNSMVSGDRLDWDDLKSTFRSGGDNNIGEDEREYGKSDDYNILLKTTLNIVERYLRQVWNSGRILSPMMADADDEYYKDYIKINNARVDKFPSLPKLIEGMLEEFKKDKTVVKMMSWEDYSKAIEGFINRMITKHYKSFKTIIEDEWEDERHIIDGGEDTLDYKYTWINSEKYDNFKFDWQEYLFSLMKKIYSHKKRTKDYFGFYSGEKYNEVRKDVAALAGWVDDYGMSDNDEIWATGLENFFELPFEHRRSIIKLMEQMA